MKTIERSDVVYIGKVEALEIMLERGIEKLPRKGMEVLTVPGRASGRPVSILGHDDNGYYVATRGEAI